MSTIRFNNQDYRALHRSLVRERRKFVDPTFPPEPASISADASSSDLEWRRPTELVGEPHLVVDGIRGSDVMQGERGNAWFVTASAALTTRAGLLGYVMPGYGGQDYGAEFHPGIFEFVFCRHGGLYSVVIDDLLPTRRGRLVYAQSAEQNEFWSALLEKAYAKLHGDYASLSRGRVVDAVAAFVRGIPEHWDMRRQRAEIDAASAETQARLAKQFQAHLSKQSLLLFSLQPDNQTSRMGDWTKESLVYGRGYILTDVQHARLKDDRTTVTLLKFQNAWFDLEWTGPWSDSSPEWSTVSLDFKDRINYQDKKDGIFWMSIGDALQQFTDIDICVVTNAGSRTWLTHTFHGEWALERRTARHTLAPSAGGSYQYPESYATNPQYLLSVTGDSSVTVSLCLEQGDPATACRLDDQLEIGIDVYAVEHNRRCRLKEPPRRAWSFARAGHGKQPSQLLRATFPPGLYALLPCTGEPGQAQSYTLRAFSQSDYSLRLLPESVPQPDGICSCCYWKQKSVTRLIVTKVTGVNAYLKKQDMMVSVRVDCEGSDLTSIQSRYCSEDKQDKDTFNVDFKVLLYRHNLSDPLEIEVFCQSAASFTKQFVGAASILDRNCASETSKETELYRNSKAIPVKLFCTVQSSDDLDYF